VLVVLAALLAVGCYSYLTGRGSNRPRHREPGRTILPRGAGSVTVRPGTGSGPGAGPGTGAASGQTATTPSPRGSGIEASRGPASAALGPGSTNPPPRTGSTAASVHGTGSTGGAPVPSPTGPSANLSISGTVAGALYPGAPPRALDLSLTNPNGYDISITSLTVSLESITLDSIASPPGQCTSSDFEIEQFSGPLPFTVGAGKTVTLSALGFPSTEMPQVEMVNQPYDQDGCEGARLNLSYYGSARS
jgi:hypothetical protein